MRTVEELQEFYNSMRGEFDEEWRVSINLEDIWVMLDHIAALEAQNAALQARVDALGEWQGVEIVAESMEEDSGYWVKSIGNLELLAIMRGSAGVSHLGTLEWGFAEPPYKVIGWRLRPDEPPTAAASESEEV